MSASETETRPADKNRRRSARLRIACACLLGMAVAGASLFAFWWPAEKSALPAGVSSAEYQRAADEFSRMFRRAPGEADVLMMLADTAIRKDRLELAVNCFAMIPSDHHRYGPSSRFQEAQILLRMNQADRAEHSFRAFLQLSQDRTSQNPEHILLARKWLVFLLAVELRFEERKLILQQMLEDRQFDVYDAKQLFFPTLLIWQSNLGSNRLQEFIDQDPADRRLLTAQARYFVGEGNLAAADQVLEKLRQGDPENPGVIAASLEYCFEKNDWDEFTKQLSRAASFSENEPWHLTLMRGEWALHNEDWETAERWLRHVLKADPANPVCHMGLARTYKGLGKHEERKAVQKRSLLLAKIRVNLAAVDNNSADAARALAADARALQMDEAAAAFETLAERMIRH